MTIHLCGAEGCLEEFIATPLPPGGAILLGGTGILPARENAFPLVSQWMPCPLFSP